MKSIKFNFILLICGFLLVSNTVFAGCDGFYVAGRGGFTDFEVDNNSNGLSDYMSNYVIDKKRVIASAALGYRYKNFRAEVEYTWRKNNRVNFVNIGRIKFKSRSYMFAVYYDFFPYTWFTPFVSAGVGYTENKINFFRSETYGSYEDKDGEFTWSLGAGISAKLTNKFNLDLGYRYYDMGDMTHDSNKSDVSNQEVYLGVRYVM